VMIEDADAQCMRGNKVVRMAGVLHKKQERISQRTKKRFAYLNLSDPTGEYEVFIGEDLLVARRELLKPGQLLELQIKLDHRDGELRLSGNAITSITPSEGDGNEGAAEQGRCTGLKVYLQESSVLEAIKTCIDGLTGAPAKNKGMMTLVMPLDTSRDVELELPGSYGLDQQFQAALKAVPGVVKISELAR
ncbi:MAG: DNA polymerase III subunit alpha, partial [Planctomycetota bacterium]